MKALVKTSAQAGLTLKQVPKPEIGPRDVLIKVLKMSICGTDLHIYNWDKWASQTIPVPMTIGHEFVGIVEAVGEDVRHARPGERVCGEGHIVCRECRNCRAGREHLCRNTQGVGVQRPGAFAEYIAIPEHNVCVIPDDVGDDIASILDPLGNAVHTALSFDLAGEDVLITGAGPIGLMAAAVCRHVGARHVVVTDLNQDRLNLAERMGATRGVRADSTDLAEVISDLGMLEGFDVGLEMSGSAAALRSMIEAMNHGGQISLLGIYAKPAELDLNRVIFKGLRLKGIYGREMFDTWHKAITMLQSGLDVSPVITHHLAFEDFEKGFKALNDGVACKVILDLAA